MIERFYVATNETVSVGSQLSELWNLHLNYGVPVNVSIATAYFNPAGFSQLADVLENVSEVRLLLGAEPEAETLFSPMDGNYTTRLKTVLMKHQERIERERNIAGLSVKRTGQLERLLAWLDSGKVEVRRLETKFLHGKAYLAETPLGVMTLVGSSNFTYSGLAKSAELNVASYEQSANEVKDWFERQWEQAVPYSLADIYRPQTVLHAPHVIYTRMLWEQFKDLQSGIDAKKRQHPDGLGLANFQVDGVHAALHHLERWNGVLITDGVGLGKTYIAGEILRMYTEDRRQRCLVIAPAALRDGPWDKFLREKMFRVDCVSYEDLSIDVQLGGLSKKLSHDLNDYQLVIIDEAHAYRNPQAARTKQLRKLLLAGAGNLPKDVVLLTATPVNNSLMDLYHLLTLFIRNDTAFKDLGVPSLKRLFEVAQATDPEQLDPSELFDVLDEVSVRRTRSHIKKKYPTAQIGGEMLRFPKAHLERVDYRLPESFDRFFSTFAYAMGMDVEEYGWAAPDMSFGQFTFGRYTSSNYLLERHQMEQHERLAVGLLRANMLKRFESSPAAFAKTCRAMAERNTDFLEGLDHGYVLVGDDLLTFDASDADTESFELSSESSQVDISSYDVERLREDVWTDIGLLEKFADDAERLVGGHSEKLEALRSLLQRIVSEASTRDERKTIVFTYFADTAQWIEKFLREATSTPELAAYAGRFAVVTGNDDKTKIAARFAPESSQADAGVSDDFDVLVATDVLAEGVNLQQAQHVVNFDLPWNPMRVIQRHGRIDRIGSPHRDIYLHSIFPAEKLDVLLKLERIIQRKWVQAVRSVGVDGQAFAGHENVDDLRQVRDDVTEDIERIANNDVSILEEPLHTSEQFLDRLQDGLQLHPDVKTLPWNAGTAMYGNEPGWVFCAHVEGHPKPYFRFVSTEGAVDRQTLSALTRASAEQGTPVADVTNMFNEETFEAWQSAREDIIEKMEMDHQDVTGRKISKPQRGARDILNRAATQNFVHKKLGATSTTLSNVTDPHLQAELKQLLKTVEHLPLSEQANEIIRLVGQMSLPEQAALSFQKVETRDVHLLCWAAIVKGPS